MVTKFWARTCWVPGPGSEAIHIYIYKKPITIVGMLKISSPLFMNNGLLIFNIPGTLDPHIEIFFILFNNMKKIPVLIEIFSILFNNMKKISIWFV